MCTGIPYLIRPKDFIKEDGTIDFKKGYDARNEYGTIIIPKCDENILEKVGLTYEEWKNKFYEGLKDYENNIQQNNSFWEKLLCSKSFWNPFCKRAL
jgi:intein/homing endonuclease